MPDASMHLRVGNGYVGDTKLSVSISGASEESMTMKLVAPNAMARAQILLSTMETLMVDFRFLLPGVLSSGAIVASVRAVRCWNDNYL